jgi:hypothetical protein
VLRPPSQKGKLLTIETWTNGFFIFASIYLQAKPEFALGLLKYCHTISCASARFSGFGWRDYDCEFRSRMMRGRESWATIDGELWLMLVVGGGAPRDSPGFSPTPGDQRMVSTGGNRGRGAESNRTTGRSGPRPCYDLNFNKAGCTRSDCKYWHRCLACNAGGHGKINCKQSASEVSGKPTSSAR